MDIKEIKQLIKKSTAVLVLDNGEPSFVVMDYESYKKLSDQNDSSNIPVHNHADNNGKLRESMKEGEVEILERINKDILALKDEIEKEEKALLT